ncbi:hypothetical protein AB0D22_07825 [Kitasatospora sp. NPDC048538]|uniref:hypothetical protein n=1 Tax=Kitasatospora sp. NPDC048538 TaxID=3155633 RepID=UPI0033C52C97
MPSPTITIAVDPTLDAVAAMPIDRSSRQWLEQAGFVRDEASGLHRLGRDTAKSTAPRIIAEATRLLNTGGYNVLRLYSRKEQLQAVDSAKEPVPVLTREPGTIWRHHVASDIAAGHLVVHARRSEVAGTTSFLASHSEGGDAVVLATEGTGFFGVTRYPDLDSAKAALEWPTAPSLPPAPSRHTAASSRTTTAAISPAALPVGQADHSPAAVGTSRSR